MDDAKYIKVRERLRGLCSRREYCSRDIYTKALRAFEGDREAAERLLEELKADRYVDDSRYASAYARDKASISGWGSVKIRYMLSSKGVGADVIAAALAEVDSEKASSRLEKLLETKRRALKDDPQWRIKLLRFGLGRGYSYDEVSSCVDNLK